MAVPNARQASNPIATIRLDFNCRLHGCRSLGNAGATHCAASYGLAELWGANCRQASSPLENQPVSPKQDELLKGRFQYLIFSPKGSVEGLLIEAAHTSTQIVFDRHDKESPLAFETLVKGQQLAVRAKRRHPRKKSKGGNAVFDFGRLLSIDGHKPIKKKGTTSVTFTGVVARFNFARHGEPNGVILDSGDFIHTKPHGLVGLALKVGDKVSARGASRSLKVGRGMVVEAKLINGKRIAP